VGFTPCVGPYLVAILTLLLGEDLGSGAVLLVAYTLGFGVPFLLLSGGLGGAQRVARLLVSHIRVVNLAGGTLVIVMGLALVPVQGRRRYILGDLVPSLLQGVAGVAAHRRQLARRRRARGRSDGAWRQVALLPRLARARSAAAGPRQRRRDHPALRRADPTEHVLRRQGRRHPPSRASADDRGDDPGGDPEGALSVSRGTDRSCRG